MDLIFGLTWLLSFVLQNHRWFNEVLLLLLSTNGAEYFCLSIVVIIYNTESTNRLVLFGWGVIKTCSKCLRCYIRLHILIPKINWQLLRQICVTWTNLLNSINFWARPSTTIRWLLWSFAPEDGRMVYETHIGKFTNGLALSDIWTSNCLSNLDTSTLDENKLNKRPFSKMKCFVTIYKKIF